MAARLGGEARRRMGAALAEEGLKLGDYSAIALINELEGAPQTTLSRVLKIDRSNVVEIVDRLEACGAVKRRSDPDDRRRHSVQLTAEGRRILKRCAKAAREVDEALFGELSAIDRNALVDLLTRVVAGYDEHVSLAECVEIEGSTDAAHSTSS